MKYQNLGATDIRVSQVAFGCWGLGGGGVWSDMTLDIQTVANLLDAAADLGINYLDTAPVYGIGTSEYILGQALKGRRDKFIVQTKCSLNWRGEGGEFEYERDGKTVTKDHRASAIRKDVEESLIRMEMDCFDSMVVHRMSSVVPVEETMGELNKLVDEGLIRAIMISNSKPADLDEYSEYGLVAGVQEKFSLLTDEQRVYFDTCAKHDATFQTYGSLEEGFLTGLAFFERTGFGAGDIRSRPRFNTELVRSAVMDMLRSFEPLTEKYGCSITNLVQAWTLAPYRKLSLLTGFRRVETMADTCKAFDIVLAPEDIAFMTAAAQKVKDLEN
ncbi:MAG: aldo/keto reductase [Atopobiaceae bacterium]|nr:aldo/keto reductase [Atopobiaceae bacterium]